VATRIEILQSLVTG